MATKAQVGMELIVSLMLILIILILITAYSIEKSIESKEIKTFLDAKRVCTSVADNLNTIQQDGKGYYKYFSLPEFIQGNYEYNISMNNNVVDIYWGDKSWVMGTIASNVSVRCLDYGLNETNRVRNKGNYLEITCYRPNLMPIKDSIAYRKNNGNVTVSVKFENDAQVDAQAFNVSIGGYETRIDGLMAYQDILVNQTIENFPLGGYIVVITADTQDEINESIEDDNSVNRTITV